MSAHSHERGHRTSGSRPLLALIFVLQRLGDACVVWFTYVPAVEVTILRGIAVGAAFWTGALLVGVWRRQSWARYLLITFTWLYIAALGLALVRRLESAHGFDPSYALGVAAVVHAVANIILVRSRRLRHFANR